MKFYKTEEVIISWGDRKFEGFADDKEIIIKSAHNPLDIGEDLDKEVAEFYKGYVDDFQKWNSNIIKQQEEK